jgi:hypothetical protein
MKKQTYGDNKNANDDKNTIFEIIERQGWSLLIDAIAESTLISADELGLDKTEIKKAIESFNNDLKTRIGD